MKPLVVLLITFCIGLLCTWFIYTTPDFYLSGRLGMSVMLLFTSLGHFKFADGMAMMLPENISFRKELVYLTAVLEIIFACALLVKPWQELTGLFIIIFFILVLPANIYAANKHVNYEQADFSGKGPNYLLFRIPLQLFFIAWVFWCAIY